MSGMPVENATVVLCHAAWADGSSWSRVILALRSRGLSVVSAQLPLTSLPDDAAALERVIERCEGPVILAGHSYAGAVITAAGGDDRVKALVYIAGMAPDQGETVGQLFFREAHHPQAPTLAPDAHGMLWMSEDGFRNAVAHQASHDDVILMTATQKPIAMRCLGDAMPSPAWRKKPSWFLLAEEDRMISPLTQRFMAERMQALIRAFAVDHTPLVTASDLVVQLILEAVRTTAAQ